MPIYAYLCNHCGKEFETMRTIAKRDDKASCPDCGQDNGERVYKPFGVSVGASRQNEPSCPAARGCPHGGSCGCH